MSKNYWNSFYSSASGTGHIKLPSQFAIFVIGETNGINNVIEFGTGNGRDAFFFASQGKTVLALDASSSAIENNTKLILDTSSEGSLEFLTYEVGVDVITDLPNIEATKFIYARFFLHSLTDHLVDRFFQDASAILKSGEKIFLEYRNHKDQSRKKVYDDHFRNYLFTDNITDKLSTYGLDCTYHVEGLGYAKFKQDDAYVSRLVIQKA